MTDDLVSCLVCGLRHRRRPDATWPRCRGPEGPGAPVTITEARARVTWGYAPEEVEHFLIEKGLSKEQAKSVLTALMAERGASFRRRGGIDAIKGGLSLAAGVGLVVLAYSLDVYATWVEDVVELPFLGGVGLIVFGSFRLARGLHRIMLGGRAEGSEAGLD